MVCVSSLLIGLAIGLIAGLLIGAIITMFVFITTKRTELQHDYDSTAESDTDVDNSKEP